VRPSDMCGQFFCTWRNCKRQATTCRDDGLKLGRYRRVVLAPLAKPLMVNNYDSSTGRFWYVPPGAQNVIEGIT